MLHFQWAIVASQGKVKNNSRTMEVRTSPYVFSDVEEVEYIGFSGINADWFGRWFAQHGS